jgi:hypothetical protein
MKSREESSNFRADEPAGGLPVTPMAVMSQQPPPEPPKPRKPPAPPAPSTAAQVAPVLAVSAGALLVLGGTLAWALATTAPHDAKDDVVAADDDAAVDPAGGAVTTDASSVGRSDDIVDVLSGVRADAWRSPRTPRSLIEALAVTSRLGSRATSGGPGMLVLGVAPGSALARTGLAGGDHISMVNGFDLASRKDGQKIYDALTNANELVVDVVRRGVPRTLRLRSHQIVASRGEP